MARMSNAAARAGLDAILATVNTGGAGTLRIWAGSAPVDCEAPDVAANNLLAELALQADAWQNATDAEGLAQAVSNAVSQDLQANNAGAPGHFRVYNGAGDCVFQGTAGGPSSGAEIEFDKSPFVADDTVQITAGLTVQLSES